METSDILRGLRLDNGSPKTLTGQIEDGIRGLIASGAYAPGDSLPARDVIAKSLGVSECVVRAALRTSRHEPSIFRNLSVAFMADSIA